MGSEAAVLAAHAAAIANAIKASGAIVSVEPEAFAAILRKIDKPWLSTRKAAFSRPIINT